jgi:hypothetical protein
MIEFDPLRSRVAPADWVFFTLNIEIFTSISRCLYRHLYDREQPSPGET